MFFQGVADQTLVREPVHLHILSVIGGEIKIMHSSKTPGFQPERMRIIQWSSSTVPEKAGTMT